ncbi:hypothetical protein [Rhizobium leguminosarum]|uniref:hypothetical protein n=1 Tax=Rhizobium leguminosarum TaxID=384 RepID=UPI003F9D85EA
MIRALVLRSVQNSYKPMIADTADAFISLAEPLKRRGETEKTGEAILALAGSIRAAKRSGAPLAGRLPVPVPRNQGIHPQRTEVMEAELNFHFHLTQSEHVKVEDIFCEVQVCVRGLLKVDELLFELEDHWRIDTQKKYDQEQGTPPREAHPLFHYQRGGHAQEAFSAHEGFVPGPAASKREGLRGLMQYPGPRIAVVPLCPTLALDAVLSQHDGPLWRQLQNIPEYLNVVTQQRSTIWALYDDALRDEKRRNALIWAVDS